MNSGQMALRAVQLVAQRGGVALAELASELQIPRSTAHRVLANCTAAGYVRQEHSGSRYVAGPALHEVALRMASVASVHDMVAPILSNLRAQLELTTSVGILEGRSVRFVASLEGGGTRPLASRLGRVVPAHSAAGGKVMLAFCSPTDLAHRYPGRSLARATNRTITHWGTLMCQLDTIRTRGWGTSIGESERGVNGLSAPIMTASGESVASVSVVAAAPDCPPDRRSWRS